MKPYAWNSEKNEQLKAGRGVSFEEVVAHIADGDVLDIIENPNQEKYRGQRCSSLRCMTMPGSFHMLRQNMRYF